MQPQVTAESSLVGQLFAGKYRIVRVIGRGGMGEVYEAEHEELGTRVAIKLMLEKYNNDGEAVARFKRESKAAGRIGNPHIIQVMDTGEAPDGRAYVVMELLHGTPLSRLIEDLGALPIPRAMRIIRQVLRAVGAAHAKGIVHRDLKPDNIFLVEGGEHPDFVKLLDFGISKIVDPDAQGTKLTTTGVVMGTPLYMAPEQAMGNEIDHGADIYACGVIFYEMLAGRPPFEGQTYAVLVAKLLTTEAPLLNELRPELPPKLVAAVHRALEKEPRARFASADAFIQALPATPGTPVELAGTIASGQQPVAALQAPPKRSLVWIILALLGGVATATTAIILTQDDSSSAKDVTTTQPVKPEATKPEATQPETRPAATRPNVTPISGRLEATSTPPGATITIDGKAYSAGSIVTLAPGKYTVRAELAGHAPAEKIATVREGDIASVVVELTAAKEPIKVGGTGTNKNPKSSAKTPPGTNTAGAAKPNTSATISVTPPETKIPKPPTSPTEYVPPPPIKTEPKTPATPKPDDRSTKPNPY